MKLTRDGTGSDIYSSVLVGGLESSIDAIETDTDAISATVAAAVAADPNIALILEDTAALSASEASIETGTVGTGNTAISFTLSADFSAVANAYPPGTIITITDATDSKQYMGRIKNYTAGKVVTLYSPLPITPATTVDAVTIWPGIALQADF